MKIDLNRFDIVMANLKTIEPSDSFDFEFRKRLREAVAKKYEETMLDKLARRAWEGLESLRYALLPKTPALVRSIVASIFIITAGLYIYSIQPSCPISLSQEGAIMVQSRRDIAAKEINAGYKFNVGDIVVTKKGAELDIGISNKYAIRVKENTKFKITKLIPRYGNGKAFLELEDGKMLVSVGEGFKGSKFEIKTPTCVTGVRGTKFSIDVTEKDKLKTKIDVLEGKVEVKGQYKDKRFLLAKQVVFVGAGQKTEVFKDEPPELPQRLVEKEWKELEELYQIGKKPQVILLLKNTPDRAKQLLAPCPIYISDEKPRQIPMLIEEAVLKIKEAIETGDTARHLESIRLLERIVEEHPNPKYDVQLFLYIGAYYEYLSYHKEAIGAFEKALLGYSDSVLASIAQCAIGIIYEESLKDPARAREAYKLLLDKYPNSLEAIWVEEKLGIKKVS